MCHAGLSSVRQTEWGKRIERVSPAALPPQWHRLGYDVSDGSLLSGLSNCGYRPDEVSPLRAEWGARLNPHGLFTEVESAMRFVDVADDRVSEHAPFAAHGLYARASGTE